MLIILNLNFLKVCYQGQSFLSFFLFSLSFELEQVVCPSTILVKVRINKKEKEEPVFGFFVLFLYLYQKT